MKKLIFIITLLAVLACGEDRPHYEDIQPETNQNNNGTPQIPSTSEYEPGSIQATQAFDDFQTGDIIFQVAENDNAEIVSKISGSPYNHCGIIKQSADGQIYVIEATVNVTKTPLDIWISRGKGYHYRIARYVDMDQILQDSSLLQNASAVGRDYLGSEYDVYFDWSNDKLYAAELVYKVFNEGWNVSLAEPLVFADLDFTNPDITAQLVQNYGSTLPMDMPVVTPQLLLESPVLNTVFSN